MPSNIVAPLQWWDYNRDDPLADGLVLLLPMWEGMGDKAHDPVNGNHGTLTNMDPATDWVPSPYGWALDFDQVNDHILIPNFSYGPRFSVGFWFQATDLAGSSFQYLFSHGAVQTQNSLNVLLAEEGQGEFPKLRTILRDNTEADDTNALDVSENYEDGLFHHYMLTVGNNDSRVYIDGVLKATSVQGGDAFNPATDVYLGGREDLNVGRFFYGPMTVFSIHARVLTADEVQELYNNPFALLEPRSRIPAMPSAPGVGNPWYQYAQETAVAG